MCYATVDVIPETARILLKSIYHMQDLAKKTGERTLMYRGYKIPKDYTEDEIKTIVFRLHKDMTSEEFVWVNQEFKNKHGIFYLLLLYTCILLH